MLPPKWNQDRSGNVKGFVRRKGDPNPANWGYHVDKKILAHPEIHKIKTNVSKPKDKEDKCKSCIKKAKRKAKDGEDSKSAGSCVIM